MCALDNQNQDVFGDDLADVAKMYQAGRKLGIGGSFYRALVCDGTLFRKVIKTVSPMHSFPQELYIENAGHLQARATMGTNFIGINEVEECFGVRFSLEELEDLKTIPYNTTQLRRRRKTHFLMPGYWITIEGMREHHPSLFQEISPVYSNLAFIKKDRVNSGWYLMRKRPLQETFGENFEDQKRIVEVHTTKEQLFRMCEIVYGAILYKHVRGERILADCCTRSSDGVSEETRICGGRFGDNGFYLSQYWNNQAYEDTGLLSGYLRRAT